MHSLILAAALLSSSGERGSASAVYEKVSPAVVAITWARTARESYFGTGTIIDPSGLIITSTTVIPKDAGVVQVHFEGGRVLPARRVLTDDAKELSLARILAPGAGESGGGTFPYVRLGDSNALHVGEGALSFGNAFQCLQDDGLVALGEGVVSGLYDLGATDSESKYRGRAIETSAHLNSGMDGGPLVNESGELIGVLCLNYSRSRWLGTAVPINDLKPIIARERDWLCDRDEPLPVYAGIELEEIDGAGATVLRVFDGGPASAMGVRAGERITGVGDEKVGSVRAFRAAFAKLQAGQVLKIEVSNEGGSRRLEVPLWGRY